jgi:hypothetical protein
LERLAKNRKRKLSREVQLALDHWIVRSHDRLARHEALARAISIVAESIERDTGRSWLDDPFTGGAICSATLVISLRYAASNPKDDAPEIPPAVNRALAKLPSYLAERYRKPEEFGDLKAMQLIREIDQAARQTRANTELDIPIFLTGDEEVLGKIGRHLGLNTKEPRR